MRAIDALLHFLMTYCFIQAIFGRQLKRLAGWIAMLGEPERDDYYRPSGYTEGDWAK